MTVPVITPLAGIWDGSKPRCWATLARVSALANSAQAIVIRWKVRMDELKWNAVVRTTGDAFYGAELREGSKLVVTELWI